MAFSANGMPATVCLLAEVTPGRRHACKSRAISSWPAVIIIYQSGGLYNGVLVEVYATDLTREPPSERGLQIKQNYN